MVDWAERAMMDGDFEPAADHDAMREAFGLAWEDCEGFLTRLGYRAKIDVFQLT